MTTWSARVTSIAAAIAHMEGFQLTASLAHRNNNPGNLRKWFDVPVVNGYVRFPTKQAGWAALCADIMANGSLTLSQFIKKYAPPNENRTGEYLEEVWNLTGIEPYDTIYVESEDTDGSESSTSQAT